MISTVKTYFNSALTWLIISEGSSTVQSLSLLFA